MYDYNNAAQNTYIGRRQPSNMTNTVTRTPQRRRPNTAYDGHDSGQQQHIFNANDDGYASLVNNLALGRGMETQLSDIPWRPDFGPPPGLQPSAPQYCIKMNDVPVHPSICPFSGQFSRQSFSQYPSQLIPTCAGNIPTSLLPAQVYNPTQLPLPAYHQPSEASDINEANDASGASRHAVGATAVPAARPSQQACRQGRVKTSRPTASHDVADSNTAVGCNNNKGSDYDKNTNYDTTDCGSDKDSNDPPDIKKQKRHQKYKNEGYEIDTKTSKFYKISNHRKLKGKREERPYTKPERVYENFERFCLRKGIKLEAKRTSKDGGEVELEYNNNGQLTGYFDDEQIREIVKYKIEESENSKRPRKDSQEPPKKGFTMWIQSSPCQAKNRLDPILDNKCRRKGCPVRGTIGAGDFRVAFDELPCFTEDGPIDPLKPALVLHLWCFERVFSREKTRAFLANGSLKGDTRIFSKEDRSLVTLEKDSKRNSRNIIEEWLEASEDDQKASVQKMINARRRADGEAEAEDDNRGNGGCEFYQEPTYTPGHLASLTCALSAWHADMNPKYWAAEGNGTRAKKRNDRNKKKPKGIRNTINYHLGDLEYRKEAKERQKEYKNKPASEQGAGTKQLEAAKKRFEEAKRKLDDAQQNYDEAEEKRDAEKHVPEKKATKKKGKRNGPAAQTAVEEASESLDGDFGGENLYTLPGTAGQGGLADNKSLHCPGSLGANQGEWPEKCDKTHESLSIVLEGEDPLHWQNPMFAATSNALMPSTPMLTAWTPQYRVQEEAPDSDEDRPLRVKQEPSQQRGLQELPDYMTVPSRVAAPRKRGQRQISDYNDAEEPPSTKRARIAAPQQVSDAAAACHTPSYGPNSPIRNKRRADGDLDDSSHKRMCQ